MNHVVVEVVTRADMLWVKVGDFIYNPANDALTSLDVAEEGMKAYITVTEPGPGGADLTIDDIRGFLGNNSIVYGILDEALQEFEEFPEYDTPYLVAEGTPPKNGAAPRLPAGFDEGSCQRVGHRAALHMERPV